MFVLEFEWNMMYKRYLYENNEDKKMNVAMVHDVGNAVLLSFKLITNVLSLGPQWSQ